MAGQSLTDFMDSLGPSGKFKAEPFLCEETDTLTMFFENTPSYAHRIDNVLTVFYAFDSNEVVGFELKGVLGKMKELRSMIVVEAQTPKVHVKLLIWAYVMNVSASERFPYEGLIKKVDNLDAMVPVALV